MMFIRTHHKKAPLVQIIRPRLSQRVSHFRLFPGWNSPNVRSSRLMRRLGRVSSRWLTDEPLNLCSSAQTSINPPLVIRRTRLEIRARARPTRLQGSCDFTKGIWPDNVELDVLNLVFSCRESLKEDLKGKKNQCRKKDRLLGTVWS